MINPTEFVKDVLVEASRVGAIMFRRNVGMGWIGDSLRFGKTETVTVHSGDVLIRKARPFHNGQAGQSDTYGWVPVKITPDMVGTTIAQHVEIECKTGSGREDAAQKSWGAAVVRSGGLYGVARDKADVGRILGR